MPAPTKDIQRRRAKYRKQQKLNALVNGNGSLRIAVRSLDNKSQQLLSDRLHFINTLGKGYVSTVFKGLNKQHSTSKSKKSSKTSYNHGNASISHDYGIQEYNGIDLEQTGIASHVRGTAPLSLSNSTPLLSSSNNRNVRSINDLIRIAALRKPKQHQPKRGNRIDDLMRIAALTQAGHEALPGTTGHLYRPPKTSFTFQRAEHPEPFNPSFNLSNNNYDKNATATHSTQRPFTAPMGLHSPTNVPLPRRTRSRQRPATGPVSSLSASSSSFARNLSKDIRIRGPPSNPSNPSNPFALSGPETNEQEVGLNGDQSLLISTNWDGLFYASRPGTANTNYTSRSSRPGTAGATGAVPKRNTLSRGSGIMHRSSCSRGSNARSIHSRESARKERRCSSRGSGIIPRSSRSRGSTRGSTRGSNARSIHSRESTQHTSTSRPGTAEHLARARERRDKRRCLRPSTGEFKNNNNNKRKSSKRPATSTIVPGSTQHKEKYWNHEHVRNVRIDAEDDYKAMVQHLHDTRHECDLVGQEKKS